MKKIVLLLMTLLASLSAWAIEQDSDGYYLIGSVADWDEFAAIVYNTDQSANAKMTADIDLGDDQTMIGLTTESGKSPAFMGIFDGQGHTLTVAYIDQGDNSLGAPFAKINGATIKNLHVTGSIYSTGFHPASIVSDTWGNSKLENIWGDVDIVGTRTGWVEASGLVGCMKDGNLTITDCMFSGTVNGAGSFNGCFIGYIDRGSATVTNCLSTGTFTYSEGGNGFRGTNNNCFVRQFPAAIPEAMQCTDEQLGDGTIATALQAGRDEVVWVQDELNGNPMLAVFMTPKPGDVNSDWLVDINDVTQLIDVVLGKNVEYNAAAADCNIDGGDGLVDINDVTALISRVLTGHW